MFISGKTLTSIKSLAFFSNGVGEGGRSIAVLENPWFLNLTKEAETTTRKKSLKLLNAQCHGLSVAEPCYTLTVTNSTLS